MRFSANLGFLFTDRPLPDAIRAAAAAGFDAVECHWPYEVPAGDVAAALAETGLPMLGLNTNRGRAGENGLTALPGRETEALAEIDRAFDYAAAIGAGAVHVMAGFAEGPAAEATFRATLAEACRRAAPLGLTVLIEPLNRYDAPGYFLTTTDQARGTIEAVDHPALKLMFDAYHVQIMEGDLCRRLTALAPLIGHVQIAAVPDRGEPDAGEVDLRYVLAHLAGLGWTAPVGAEYRPRSGSTEAGLGWLPGFRAI
ncbi:MAG: TIM barrel protein [Pseudomonadota bacterium]|nr:TIM barrel protein [Pseudomonadota bacterium]MEE3100602.1 TIM barrel protein [Pseudomonadota bacterium]